jgi:hypothetical protein
LKGDSLGPQRRILVLAIFLFIVGTVVLWIAAGKLESPERVQTVVPPTGGVNPPIPPSTPTPLHELVEQPPIVEPIALPVLRLMPDSSAIALAMPPLGTPGARLLALARRLAPDTAAFDAQMEELVHGFAEDFGVADARTIGEIAERLGIDVAAPSALFAGPDLFQSLTLAEEGDSAAHMPGRARIPALVAVLPAHDPALLEWVIVEMLKDIPGAKTQNPEQVDENGTAVKWILPNLEVGVERVAWFSDKDHVVVGTSLDMVREVARRRATPATISYGTNAFPAESEDEIIVCSRLNSIMKAYGGTFARNAAADDTAPETTQQPKDAAFAPLSGTNAPLITAIQLKPEWIGFTSTWDLTGNQPMINLTGTPAASRLYPLLPSTTGAFLTYVVSDPTKIMLKQGWLASAPRDMKADAGFTKIDQTVDRFLSVLGGEVTVAASPLGMLGPTVTAMCVLKDPAGAYKLIEELALPATSAYDFAGIEINTVALGPVFAMYYGISGDVLFASNDKAQLHDVLERFLSGRRGDLLENLTPALSDRPRIGVLVVRDTLLELPALFQLASEGTWQTQTLSRIHAVFSELRMESFMEDNKAVTQVKAFVKP